MNKNLVVSLNEIKGIRIECEKCESEVVLSPAKLYLYGHACPNGHPWQENPGSQNDYMSMFIDALRQLIESPPPFGAVRLEIDAKLTEGREGRNE